jgi:hypothetical protein
MDAQNVTRSICECVFAVAIVLTRHNRTVENSNELYYFSELAAEVNQLNDHDGLFHVDEDALGQGIALFKKGAEKMYGVFYEKKRGKKDEFLTPGYLDLVGQKLGYRLRFNMNISDSSKLGREDMQLAVTICAENMLSACGYTNLGAGNVWLDFIAAARPVTTAGEGSTGQWV